MTEKQRVRMQPNPKWIRGVHRGRTVVDSRNVTFVWEVPYYPAWYVPLADVAAELRPTGATDRSPSRGEATRFDLMLASPAVADPEATGREPVIITNAAWRHLDSPVPELRDLVRIEWEAMDAWFEEDVEVFVHPRSPDVRIDALASSKHVRVFVDGELVADSVRPTVLYEASLPPRFYLPQADVQMSQLVPSMTSSACPYKGWAQYWSVATATAEHVDLAWGYRTPLPESAPIAGLVCFYNEKVEIEVDGHMLDRPRTKFS